MFRTKLNIYDGAFFTSVKPYFKNVLNSTELPLSSIFYTTHSFVKKLTILKTLGEKVLLTMEHFFSKFEITQWNVAINKQEQPLEVFYKKGVLREFAKFTEIHLYQSLFFNQV